MDLDKGIAETMAAEMPSAEHIAACRWMTEAELEVNQTIMAFLRKAQLLV